MFLNNFHIFLTFHKSLNNNLKIKFYNIDIGYYNKVKIINS